MNKQGLWINRNARDAIIYNRPHRLLSNGGHVEWLTDGAADLLGPLLDRPVMTGQEIADAIEAGKTVEFLGGDGRWTSDDVDFADRNQRGGSDRVDSVDTPVDGLTRASTAAVEWWLADEDGKVLGAIEGALFSASMDRGRGEKISDQAEVVRVLRALRDVAAEDAAIAAALDRGEHQKENTHE